MRSITTLCLCLMTCTSFACPKLIAYCQKDHMTRLGYITYDSSYHGALPECQSTMTHMNIIRECKNAFPETSVIIYTEGADFSLLKTQDALTTEALTGQNDQHWDTRSYQNEIDLTPSFTFGEESPTPSPEE